MKYVILIPMLLAGCACDPNRATSWMDVAETAVMLFGIAAIIWAGGKSSQ